MRIVHLGKYYPPAPGGIEAHVQTLAKAQAALGAKVTVLCVNHENRCGSSIRFPALTATPTVTTSDGAVQVTRVGRRASVARFDLCPDLISWMHLLKPACADLIHLHVPNPTMLLALALKRPRVPLVVTYHSDVVRQKLLVHALRPAQRYVFARAAQILSDSPTYASGSACLANYAHKVGVLPLGINLRPYLSPSAAALAFARQLRAEHGSPLWLCVGRLVYYKGLPVALEALRAVAGKLVVIGVGPLEAHLRKLAQEQGVADRVVWLGYRSFDEVVGAFHAATALWFPSNARSEGFGLVQVEAMASGCPVINTAIAHSGVSWVSRHEETGLTVPINDPAALAHAATRLLRESGLRERLAHGARARAVHEFDHRLMAQRSVNLYRKILGDADVEQEVPLRESA